MLRFMVCSPPIQPAATGHVRLLRRRRVSLLAMLLLTPVGALAQGASNDAANQRAAGYVGVWFDDTGKGAVEILPCGRSLCGRIAWLRSPNDRYGRPLRDGYNPEPRRRTRPICGLPVIGNLRPQQSGSWDNGWIYDPKVGKRYDVELRLRSADVLQVTGYLGVKFLSKTLYWRRAPENLPRCQIPG